MRHFVTGAAVAIAACAMTTPAGAQARTLTADGDSYVVETREQLDPADADTAYDVYLRKPSGDELVSVGTSADAIRPAVSADGSRVSFLTDEQLDPADTDTAYDYYVRGGGQTRLVTTGPTDPGAVPGDFILLHHLSDDGTRVLFQTSARMVAADTDSETDLYSRAGGVTTLVTPGPGGSAGTWHTVIGASSDGTRVYELTNAPAVATDDDTAEDLYLRSGGTAQPVFTGTLAANPNGTYRTAGGASRDGSSFLFSTPVRLEPGDTNDTWDLYQRRNGRTRLITANQVGLAPECPLNDHPSGWPPACAIFRAGQTADGGTIAFGAAQQLALDDKDNWYDVYARRGPTSSKVSEGEEAWISDDGSRTVIHSSVALVPEETGSPDETSDHMDDLFARVNGQFVELTPGTNETPTFVAASRDLTRVFFSTTEALVPGDTDTQRDVYQTVDGTIRLVTTGPTDPQGDWDYTEVTPSDDGSSVTFSSPHALTADDTDGSFSFYVWQDGVTTLLLD